jgi:hypothetical protein
MSNVADPPTSDTSHPAVINPASKQTINRMGFWLLTLTVLFFYLLITTWPVLEGTEFKPFNIFGMPCSWAPDRQLMFTVMMAGAVGSLTHTLTSFGDYVGNRELSTNWIWFLILRIPVGIALALLFYFIIRGGLLIPTIQIQKPISANEATVQVNAYSIAAFSALAGMFSKQATDKLAAVFDAVFAMKQPVDREGALGSSQPLTVVPAALTRGKRQDLTVTGSGFQKDTTATINGKNRPFTMTDAAQGKVAILDEDVSDVGKLDLVVTNPNKDNFRAIVEVVAPVKPVIASTNPAELTATSAKSLTVIGTGFQTACTATVNGEARPVASGDDTALTVTLQDKDIATPTTLKLIVTNPGADGQASDVREIAVK